MALLVFLSRRCPDAGHKAREIADAALMAGALEHRAVVVLLDDGMLPPLLEQHRMLAQEGLGEIWAESRSMDAHRLKVDSLPPWVRRVDMVQIRQLLDQAHMVMGG